MSRPRNERRVGDQFDKGQLSGGVSGDHVWVTCARLGVGVGVKLHPDDAEDFADGMYEWARLARANAARPKD